MKNWYPHPPKSDIGYELEMWERETVTDMLISQFKLFKKNIKCNAITKYYDNKIEKREKQVILLN